MLLSLTPVGKASAEDFVYTTNNGTITVTGYTGPIGATIQVMVPAMINGLPVTCIGSNAFDRAYIGGVFIPNTVITIGDRAFSNCTFARWAGNYPIVEIPNSVTNVGAGAFANCMGLTYVIIPESVITIGKGAFDFCQNLASINVDVHNPAYCSLDGVLFDKAQKTLIRYPEGNYALSYVIPNAVVAVDEVAFRASSLTNVTIPSSVVRIGNQAFDWSSLTSVTMLGDVPIIGVAAVSSNLTSIGVAPFSNCHGLRAIIVSSNNPAYTTMTGILFDKTLTALIENPSGNAVDDFKIPDSVASIGDYAFQGSTSLKSVEISSNVTNIGSGAFRFTGSLTNVKLGSSIAAIGNLAFEGCDSLTSLIVPSSVIRIGDGAFAGCSSLTNIAIQDGVVEIGSAAFSTCASLTRVEIPNSVISIEASLFRDCSSLSSITLGNGVSAIRNRAFWGCYSLSRVVIPNNVTRIEEYAFQGCSGLTNITVGSGVLSIGQSAFANCASLKSVEIPASVINIENFAFAECHSLTEIIVNVTNSSYSSVDGVLFNKSQTKLVEYPCGKAGCYVIPNGIIIIGQTFKSCFDLTSVTIPGSVTNIDAYAFQACTSLSNLYFEGDAPGLGPGVFGWDDNPTVNYLPGASGWGTNFGGLPTAVWLPQVCTSDPTWGIRNNQFGFSINWARGMTFVVEARNLLHQTSWAPISTNAVGNGSFYFTDSQWTNFPARIYRIRWP